VATYDETKQHDNTLIRKALSGSLFVAPFDADPITTLTTYTAAVTGPPAVPEKIELTTLPTDWEDLGYLTDDGVGMDNEVSTSDTTSWQSTQPTRSDITTDTDTITVVAQETKLLTVGLYTGAVISPTALATNTKELAVAKPARPSSRYWRGLAVAVDGEGDEEFFIARFYPRLKVTGRNAQTFNKSDDPITWGVTLTSYVDDDLGYSCKYLFGGKGWKAKAEAMGFTV
jgi:hypothetical protein